MENYALTAIICYGISMISLIIYLSYWKPQFNRRIRLVTLLSGITAFIFGALDISQNLNCAPVIKILPSAFLSLINTLISMFLCKIILSPKKILTKNILDEDWEPWQNVLTNSGILLIWITALTILSTRLNFSMYIPSLAIVITLLAVFVLFIIFIIVVKPTCFILRKCFSFCAWIFKK